VSEAEDPKQPAGNPEEDVQEKLLESSDAETLRAEAEVLKAEAELAKAKLPLVDRLIMRGVIPIALAIVGPWAAMTFSEAKAEWKTQRDIIVGLKEHLKDYQKESEDWQQRMAHLEQERAEELVAMTNMVNRLDHTLKMALIQLAVTQRLKGASGVRPLSRSEVTGNVAAQLKLPGMTEEDVQQVAEEEFDRIQAQEQVQQQQD
jgi:hypothetical protein